LIDSGEAEYLLWYVMPYVPGDNLRQTLRREARLRIPDAARMAVETLDALEHAHTHGIAPRATKPANIVLAPGGAVRVGPGSARAREATCRALAARPRHARPARPLRCGRVTAGPSTPRPLH